MQRFAIALAVLAVLATPAFAETYFWGEIGQGGVVWIDGWGEWGEVGFWYDDYYVDVYGIGQDWLYIEDNGDIWVDGSYWGYLTPVGDVYSDARGYLFTMDYDPVADEFSYDGVVAWDAPTCFFVLAFEERYFDLHVGLYDVLTFNLAPDALIQYGKVPGTWNRLAFIADVLDLDGDVTSVEWDFGDGTWTDMFDPVHSYGRPGKYWVTLTAWDNVGAWDETGLWVWIRSSPPTATFARTMVYSTPGKVQFYDKSKDRNGSVVEWLWDFGDGRTSTERNPVHIYASPGTYFVSLTVTDQDGQVGVRVKNMKVQFK